MTPKSRYIRLCQEQSLPLFFQPQWLDRVSKNWNVALAEADGKITAVWIYTIERKIGVTLIRNPLLTPYLGPLFLESAEGDKDLQEARFLELLIQLPKWQVLDVLCLPGFNEARFFDKQNISVTPRITYHLDLQPDEEVLLKQIGSKQRYAIRQAEKDLVIEEASHQYAHFYRLHRETLKGKGERYPYSESFFQKLFENTRANHSSYITAAHNAAGHLVTMACTVYDQETMYLLLTSYDKKLRHNGGVALLIWDAIKKAKAMGLKTFDFEGSMDKGVANFFKSFGGKQITYLHATSNRSFLWRLKKRIRP